MNKEFNKNKREIRFFQTCTGVEPVRKWLKQLTEEEKKIIGVDIKMMELNWPIGMPLIKNLGDGLWEIRSNLPNKKISRIIFFIYDKYFVLLDGFIKKTKKTPLKEVKLAKKRKRQFEISI